MKEAGRTSLLSRRWRYIWAYFSSLNFDACKILDELILRKKSLQVEKPRYLRWVDQVVNSHKALTVEDFRVRFDLGECSSHNIDNWVRFAMEKRVKRLEMDFSQYRGGSQSLCYTFPSLIFLCNSLTSLKLAYVNVIGEILEMFLCSCQALDFLSVKGSKSLIDLKVTGLSLNLKYLTIYYCFKIKHLEIFALNFVFFNYFGPKISLPFKSTPKLSEILIGGEYGCYLTNNFLEFSSSLSQLEALTLNVPFSTKYVMKSIEYPVLTRLKKLDVRVDPLNDEDLFCLSSLIKACPFLQKFVLQLSFCADMKRKRLRKRRACSHYHLKIVEILRFVGNAIDMEFAIYLLKNAVSLEKIIVDPRDPWEFKLENKRREARKQAEQLHAYLKPGTDLVIL